jgi:hypothetical protein
MLGKKCMVPTCPNHISDRSGKVLKVHDDNGMVEGQEFICTSCWKTILGRGDIHSWLYKSCTGLKNDN